MAIISVIDFETTHEPPNGEVIEVGICDLSLGPPMVMFKPESEFIKPSCSISIGAMAVHHLTDNDVANGLSQERMIDFLTNNDVLAYAAHNAKVEMGYFQTKKPWICTYKCAAKFWPEAEKHTNQYLRYYLNLNVDKELAHPPHRAGPDAYVTAFILRELLKKASVEELIKISSEPITLSKIPFGKFFGMEWKSADISYLQWVVRQEFDENVIHTATMELNRRTGRH